MTDELRRLLEDLAAGRCTVEEVLARLRLFSVAQVGEFARLDLFRDHRKAVPEVIYGAGKTDEQLLAIVRAYLAERGFALVARLQPERGAALVDAMQGYTVRGKPELGSLGVYAPGYEWPEAAGCVGLLTAGTADIPVAEEAALVMEHMGCRVERAYDIGVAGLHRLAEPLHRLLEAQVDVLVVVAGMEGALPSVVAGLVDVPVIGVPASTGYGLGGDGTAALYAMLQSCSPGLVVVNIDNGVGAGAAAALIARRR
ncbi:MAG: nickel pincer cofactor biosynthesis protein LarB [Thermoleophilia bacterium]|nr:nickel pincer cofactor biosynthesis protein LarB [Thermoleophilia bacterium]